MRKYMKGATILGFTIEEGTIIATDSRVTNSEYIKTDKNEEKMFEITSNKIGAMAGILDDANEMVKHVKQKIAKRFMKGKDSTILEIAQIVSNHVLSKPLEVKVECLIGGWDESLANCDLWKCTVDSQTSLQLTRVPKGKYAACGTGYAYAMDIFNSSYRHNMEIEEARDMAIRALLNASFFDKHTGGDIKVYLVQRSKWKRIYISDALSVYLNNFDALPMHVDCLFMLIPREGYPPFYVHELSQFFRSKFGVSTLAVHCVTLKAHFSFHRLLVRTPEECGRILAQVKKICPLPKKKLGPGLRRECMARFSRGFYYEEDIVRRPIYVERKSLPLLQEIRDME